MLFSKLDMIKSQSLDALAEAYGLEDGIKSISDIEITIDAIKWDLARDAEDNYRKMLEESNLEEDDEYE